MRSGHEDPNWLARTKFGCAVEEARIDLQLTQAELAREIGTTQMQIEQIENTGIGPVSMYFSRLCEALGLEAESFGFVTVEKRGNAPCRKPLRH